MNIVLENRNIKVANLVGLHQLHNWSLIIPKFLNPESPNPLF